MKLIDEYFETAMEAWDMMQKTSGDEGADWAERFERYFYEFIDELKKWWKTLQPKPTTIEEAEQDKSGWREFLHPYNSIFLQN